MTIRSLLTAAAVLCLTLAAVGGAVGGFVVSEGPAPQIRPQRQSHLRVYFHDIVSGRSPTVVQIARAARTNASATFFGAAYVMDDPLTEGQEMSSRLVGGHKGWQHHHPPGEEHPFSKVRELPVIAGSGLFRFATGYCRLTTHRLDLTTGDAVVEYNIFLLHQ
ncbi:unnamed protein product [Spirodela intermedia]|uniref:Dirigent protein n=1 Tax=Spirodela intermedia TaxID=51605 RepID=A0A7I8ITK2_SPIIN|nr:unnamed protein product [Spirodela intermedia]CAA6660457.1 unnamed protein product [Spirodela intermedia]